MYEQISDLAGLCKTPARFWVCVKGHGTATLPVERIKSDEATATTVYRKGDQRFFELWSRFYKIPDGELHHIDGDDDINLSAMTDEQVIGYIKYENHMTNVEWAKRNGAGDDDEQVHMDEPFVVRFSEQGAKMQVNGATIIKDWYHKAYPIDPCWEDMHESHNFMDLYNCLNDGEEVYDCLFNGTGMDSLIRKRCFQQLAELMHCEYGVVYDQWLHGGEIRKERIAEAVRNCTAILNRDGYGHAYCKREKVWTNCEKLGRCTLDCGGPYGEEE